MLSAVSQNTVSLQFLALASVLIENKPLTFLMYIEKLLLNTTQEMFQH